jgi:hypothetical protein
MCTQLKSRSFFTNGIFSALCVSFLNIPVQNNISPLSNGVGSRALSFAGNYVSESGDISGLFWNPAGLSLNRANGLTISGDWLMLKSHTNLITNDNLPSTGQSIRLNGIGLIGVNQEYPGLTTGIGYQNAFSFNDINKLQANVFQSGDSIEINERFISRGGLNFLSIGLGVPISNNFSIGGTISYAGGSQKVLTETNQHIKGRSPQTASDNFTTEIKRIYKGYDLRLGFLYQPQSWIRTGGRLVLPSVIKFSENSVQKFKNIDSTYTTDRNGQLRSSLSGALGASFIFAAATVSAEFRFRAPYNYFDIAKVLPRSDASVWKKGTGMGVELNPKPLPFLIRAGYSLDQIDPCAFLLKYDDSSTVSSLSSSGSQKTISSGIGINICKRATVNCTYIYYIQNLKYLNGLKERNEIQRVMMDLMISY